MRPRIWDRIQQGRRRGSKQWKLRRKKVRVRVGWTRHGRYISDGRGDSLSGGEQSSSGKNKKKKKRMERVKSAVGDDEV